MRLHNNRAVTELDACSLGLRNTRSVSFILPFLLTGALDVLLQLLGEEVLAPPLGRGREGVSHTVSCGTAALTLVQTTHTPSSTNTVVTTTTTTTTTSSCGPWRARWCLRPRTLTDRFGLRSDSRGATLALKSQMRCVDCAHKASAPRTCFLLVLLRVSTEEEDEEEA